MISGIVSRSSAAFLGGAGMTLLFAPDVVFAALTPDMPVHTHWVGQLLAAAWLGIAALNWLQRGVVIGGIYARPLVYTNFVLYLVSALTMLRVALAPVAPVKVWLLTAPLCVLAVTYAALMFKGPFDPLSDATTGGAP